MTLVETILLTWFAGGLLAVLLIGARGVAHELWCRVASRGGRSSSGRRDLGGGGPPRETRAHHVGR